MSSTNTNVIALHPRKHNLLDPIGPWAPEQIKVGTKLCYFGKLNPGVEYTVTYIKSWRRSSKGNYYGTRQEIASHLSDEISLIGRWHGERDLRVMSFAYLSYSSIWRIIP